MMVDGEVEPDNFGAVVQRMGDADGDVDHAGARPDASTQTASRDIGLASDLAVIVDGERVGIRFEGYHAAVGRPGEPVDDPELPADADDGAQFVERMGTAADADDGAQV